MLLAEHKSTLLKIWEETYKKGQLSFWLLLSLRDKPRYVNDIKGAIEEITKGTITCEEQSLYRALRKYRDMHMVEFQMREGNRGPDRKYYFLTELGKEVLKEFIDRNIKLLYDEELSKIILASD